MDFVWFGCCTLAFLLFYNTLEVDFVYDDRRAILQNPDVLSSTPLINLFKNDFWGTPLNYSGSHGSFRPLCILTFRLNYLFDGFRPWGYHLVNVLLHVLATGLFVCVSRCLLSVTKNKNESSLGSAVAGVLFAVHPVHVEAVASLVGRADLAACNLFLLALLCYIKHVKYRDYNIDAYVNENGNKRCQNMPKQLKYLVKCAKAFTKTAKIPSFISSERKRNFLAMCSLAGCIFLSCAALLAKETGITVLAVCIVYDFTTGRRRTHYKNQLRSVAFLMLTATILTFLRLEMSFDKSRIHFSAADNPTSRTPSVTTRFFTFAYLPVFNFLILLFPYYLSFDWGMDAVPRITTIYDSKNLTSAVFYGILLFTASRSMKALMKRQTAGTCQDMKKSSFCDCCNLEVNNNNSKHLTSTKSCCRRIKGSILCKTVTFKEDRHSVILVSLALIVFPFLPATNLFFYVGFVVAERILYIPSTGLCLLVGLGASKLLTGRFKVPIFAALIFTVFWFSARTVLRNKDWLTEESLYRSAIHINPAKAYGNLGSILSSQERSEEAEFAFRTALKYRPNMADVHYNLGALLYKTGRINESIQSFLNAIHFRPSLTLAYLNLGVALADSGKYSEAITVLRQGTRLNGNGLRDKHASESARISILMQLGRLYSEQGRLRRALAVFREAANSLPSNYPTHRVYNILGETLVKLNQFSEAELWFVASLNAKPLHIPAHITYGKLLAKNSTRLAEAEQWFKRAQTLAPQDYSVYHHYSEFLRGQRRFQEAALFAKRAAELKPMDLELTIIAATSFKQLNNLSEAEYWYRRAVYLKSLVK